MPAPTACGVRLMLRKESEKAEEEANRRERRDSKKPKRDIVAGEMGRVEVSRGKRLVLQLGITPTLVDVMATQARV